MRYIVSCQNPHHHIIEIEFIINDIREKELIVQLPAWRPGRYELANFAQNIMTFIPRDEKGKSLSFEKITKDRWKIKAGKNSTVHIHYSYYANELNAGSSLLDESQLYINGVNCFLYVPDRIDQSCELRLELPDDYEVATGLKSNSKNQFTTQNYHELVDCPLIAGNSLQKNAYKVKGTEFTIWFQGEVKPNWKKIIKNFEAFTKMQLKMMDSFPFKEYHFLFQILPFQAYHGVEHQNSTVIAIGPSYDLMEGDWYEEFLGVSSHELFHAWNVKAIRPAEMEPYDYSRENYSRLGYVAEGVTTYYGDLHLLRSGVFNEKQYLKTFDKLLERHYNNFGRFNLSVADSSFDTWLDGYKPGAPGRKTSIYTEGALCAFMMDILIRKNTKNKKSLDDVVLLLFERYGQKKGYSEKDYKKAVEEIANASFQEFFEKYVCGIENYEPLLKECLDYIGLELKTEKDTTSSERKLGFKSAEVDGKTTVTAIYPNSIADNSALQLQDEIIALNRMRVENNINEWLDYFSMEKEITLTVATGKRIREIALSLGKEDYYLTRKAVRKKKPTKAQKINYNKWAKI